MWSCIVWMDGWMDGVEEWAVCVWMKALCFTGSQVDQIVTHKDFHLRCVPCLKTKKHTPMFTTQVKA